MSKRQVVNRRVIKRMHMCFCGIAAFALPPVSIAHHGVSRYDMETIEKIEGVVEDWHWQSPHIALTLRVVIERQTLLWDIEGAPPRWMSSQGFAASSLTPGETITVVYHPFKAAANGGILMEVVRADGETLKVNRPARLGGP